MNFEYYKKYFTKGTIGKYDMAPLYSDPIIFKELVEDIVMPFKNESIDKIVALDALGFILGAYVSARLNKGLIIIRKGRKIPIDIKRKISREFIDYSGSEKTLELDKDMIIKDENYLIIDDWIETGSQVKAAIEMIEYLGGNVVGISTIGSDRNKNTEELFIKYNLKSIGLNV